MEFEKRIENKLYVSFDIFDTLITRNVIMPEDIFDIVENVYNCNSIKKISSFSKNRIFCEKLCRNEKNTEITIDEIYTKMEKFYIKEDVELLKQLEMKIELKMCQKNNNKFVYSIYDYAIKRKKKIIIISDMYLSYDFIKELLKKNNLYYDKLYVSSKVGFRKKDTSLFSYVINDLGIDKRDIIHIGDNKISDYKSPKKLGIDSILIKNMLDIDRNKMKMAKQKINYNIIESFIIHNLEDLKSDDYYERFGYTCFGPLLYGFISWLVAELKKKSIHKVYFLARDGQIMKKAFDQLTNGDFQSFYLYASRRSLVVPAFCSYSNIDDIINSFNVPKNIKLIDLIERLGIEPNEVSYELKEYNLDLKKNYDIAYLKSGFLDKIYNLLVHNSKIEKKNLENYLEYMKFEGKLAIVDIGWFGNMQNALQTITNNNNIYGYYLGLRKNKKTKINAIGYMFDKDKHEDLDKDERYFNAIFELIFSADHGSVKRFVNTSEFVELLEYENEENTKNRIELIQKGALEFCKSFESISFDNYIFDSVSTSFNLFERLRSPRLVDVKKLGYMKFKDGEENYLANFRGKLYLNNPTLLIKDLKSSQWKIAFLKHLFKIPLPYYKLCKLIARIK